MYLMDKSTDSEVPSARVRIGRTDARCIRAGRIEPLVPFRGRTAVTPRRYDIPRSSAPARYERKRSWQ
jgi:hypothetical protein